MIRFVCTTLLALAMLAATPVHAEENPLIGTWKLKSFIRQATTGERYNQLGDSPDGYIYYASDGRMMVMMVDGRRPKPAGSGPTDEESAKLQRSMLAYGGTYRIEGDKVIHHIDIAWDNTRLDSDQVRFFSLDGRVLTLKTEQNKSPLDGREGYGLLVWEKVVSAQR